MIFAEEKSAAALAKSRNQVPSSISTATDAPKPVIENVMSKLNRLRWRNALQKLLNLKRWGQGPDFAKAIGDLGGDENTIIKTRSARTYEATMT